MTNLSHDQQRIARLLAGMATDLQQVPASAARTERVVEQVTANNTRVLHASRLLLGMDDHPDIFDAWSRTFISAGSDA